MAGLDGLHNLASGMTVNTDAMRKQLEGILIQLDGVAASVQATMEIIGPAPCEHPLDDRQDLSTMGIERWTCRRCGFKVERPMGSD
jgi:hypothetical protein